MRRRTKVVLVVPLPPPIGGIIAWASLLSRTPVDDDIERVFVNTSVAQGYYGRVGLARVARRLWRAMQVYARVATERADVVHVTTSYERGWRRDMLFLDIARRRGAATIMNIHGGDFDRVYRAATPRQQRHYRDKLARCDAVVAITEETAHFLRGLGLTNVHVIPNCIDIRPPVKRVQRGSPVRWLFIGFVVPAKGIPEMIEALRHFPDAHLTIIGPTFATADAAPLIESAQREPGLQGRISYLGPVSSDVARAAYTDHDLLIFPTRRDGFPIVVLEAMEAALPIVATRVGAIPDMLVDGEHGLLVPPGDQAALHEAIRRLMANPEWAAKLGAAARARAIADYDVARVAGIWSQLYRAVASRSSAER